MEQRRTDFPIHKPTPLWLLLAAPAVGGLIDVGLNAVNRLLLSPFFFDSIMTAVVAAVFGLWPGLATALLTQLGMEAVVTAEGAAGTAMPFVFCGFATALIVSSLAKAGKFRTPAHLLIAMIAVTLANSVVGSITATLVFGGRTLHASDYLVGDLIRAGQSLFESAFWARIPINLIDKGLAVGVAFAAVTWFRPPVASRESR